MKNRFFQLRLLNFIIIMALLGAYQVVSLGRASDEAAAMEQANAAAAEQTSETGVSVYKDGTFTGSAQGYGGLITVEVVLENDVIKEINAVSHSGEGAAYWDMASSMINEMIKTQSPNVDAVSGATYSSTGIHNAVTEALRSALAE